MMQNLYNNVDYYCFELINNVDYYCFELINNNHV